MCIQKYTRIFDTDIRLSFRIEGGICHTTDAIRRVVYFIDTTYDTTRLYASVVLQVSSNNKATSNNKIMLDWLQGWPQRFAQGPSLKINLMHFQLTTSEEKTNKAIFLSFELLFQAS